VGKRWPWNYGAIIEEGSVFDFQSPFNSVLRIRLPKRIGFNETFKPPAAEAEYISATYGKTEVVP
jgi:hypothetical protein